MKVSVENVNQHEVILTVTVDEKEVTKSVKQAVSRIASQVNVPGFRKGKAPRKILEAQFGKEAILGEAFEGLVNKFYPKALLEEGIEPVSDPKIDKVEFEEGKPATFKATFTKKPEVTLGEYKKFDIKKEEAVVTEEDVQKQLDNIKNQHAKMVVAPEGSKVEKDDFAVIDFLGKVDGEAFEGGEGKSYPLQIGSNSFIPGFEDQLIGAKVGDDVEVKVQFPADYQVAELAGKDAVFECHVHDIKRKELPELNDDFAKEVSAYDTYAELEADLRKQLNENAHIQAEEKFNAEVIKTAVNNAQVDVPEIMIDERVENMIQEQDMKLATRGMQLATYLKMVGKTMDDLRAEYRPTAAENVRADLVLEAIVKAENIEVTPDDMNLEIYMMSQNFGADPKEVWDIIVKEGRIGMLRRTVSRKKAARFLVEQALGGQAVEAVKEEAKTEKE